MSVQPAGALRFRPVYVDQVTRDMALLRMIAEYGQERAYFFCNRLTDIICDTPNGRLTLIDPVDYKAVASMMELGEDLELFRAMIEYAATKAKYFDANEWKDNHTLTSTRIQEEIAHSQKKKVQDSLRQAKNRSKTKPDEEV